MTKLDKIKEVYGELFVTHGHLIDEDGWLDNSSDVHYLTMGQTKQLGECEYRQEYEFRPKELQGLEINNGWNSLEESKFPEDIDSVFWFNNDNGEFEVASLLHCDFAYTDYTHWHKLPPKPPIY